MFTVAYIYVVDINTMCFYVYCGIHLPSYYNHDVFYVYCGIHLPSYYKLDVFLIYV